MEEIDSSSLDRILLRLHGTTNENLQSVLSLLIPKLLPLLNNSTLRTKVIEVLTEALKRFKLYHVPLDLVIFTSLIQPENMPFGCNFGIAFLDVVFESKCIQNIATIEAISKLISAIDTFPLYSYQSNSMLFYTTCYMGYLSELIQKNQFDITISTKAILHLGDYFLDVLLLQPNQLEKQTSITPNTSELPQSFLSTARLERLISKKKQIPAIGLQQLKLTILESLKTTLFDDFYRYLLLFVAIHDKDVIISQKAEQILNLFKENIVKTLELGEKLLTILYQLPTTRNEPIFLDRNHQPQGFDPNIHLHVFQFMLDPVNNHDNHSKFVFNLSFLSVLYLKLTKDFQGFSSNSTSTNGLLPFYYENTLYFLQILLEKTIKSNEQNLSVLNNDLIIKGIKLLLLQLTSQVPEKVAIEGEGDVEPTVVVHYHTQLLNFRTSLYDLIHCLLHAPMSKIIHDTDLLISLLFLAEHDVLSTKTNLFHVLTSFEELLKHSSTSTSTPNSSILPAREGEETNELIQQIRSLKSSHRSTCRLLHLKFANIYFGVSIEYITSLLYLSQDDNDLVLNFVYSQFQEIYHTLFTLPPDMTRYIDYLFIVSSVLHNAFLELQQKQQLNTTTIQITWFEYTKGIKFLLSIFVELIFLLLQQTNTNISYPIPNNSLVNLQNLTLLTLFHTRIPINEKQCDILQDICLFLLDTPSFLGVKSNDCDLIYDFYLLDTQIPLDSKICFSVNDDKFMKNIAYSLWGSFALGIYPRITPETIPSMFSKLQCLLQEHRNEKIYQNICCQLMTLLCTHSSTSSTSSLSLASLSEKEPKVKGFRMIASLSMFLMNNHNVLNINQEHIRTICTTYQNTLKQGIELGNTLLLKPENKLLLHEVIETIEAIGNCSYCTLNDIQTIFWKEFSFFTLLQEMFMLFDSLSDSLGISLITTLCHLARNNQQIESTIAFFLNKKWFLKLKPRVIFHLAENLLQLVNLIPHTTLETSPTNRSDVLMQQYLVFIMNLEKIINPRSADLSLQQTHVIFLLVICAQFPTQEILTINFNFAERILRLILFYLNHADPLLKDLSVIALCHLFSMTRHYHSCDQIHNILSGFQRYKSLCDYIAKETIVSLTRKRIVDLPLGYDDSSRGSVPLVNTLQDLVEDINIEEIEEIINNNPDPNTSENTSNTNNTNTTDTNNTANEQRDEVLEAAMRAAANEMRNIANQAQAQRNNENNNNNNPSSSTSKDTEGYGTYAKISKIISKCGDSELVVMILPYIRYFPQFGIDETEFIYAKYRHPKVILSETQIDSIVPYLFVAKFDPIKSIRTIMTQVWVDLVHDKDNLLIQRNERTILECIESNLLHPVWREREAACLALETFLINRSWSSLHQYFSVLLVKGLKILDDLRESTRLSASKAMKALSTHILRATLPSEHSMELASQVMNETLTILLDKGLVSASAESRGYSLGIMLKIIQQQRELALHGMNNLLLPWLERLIDILLESMSALEPQMFQYLQFHTHSMRINGEELEKMRLEVAEHSPMQEALRECLKLVPLQELPKISNIIYFHLNSGVGLATRVSAANALSLLVEINPAGMTTCSNAAFIAINRILATHPALEATLKRAMISAQGNLSKIINTEALESVCQDLMELLINWHKNDDEENAIANSILQIVKRTGDRIRNIDLWYQILAYSFIGSFTTNNQIKEIWNEAFNSALIQSGIGSQAYAIHKCASLICENLPFLLSELSWERRKQGIRTLKTLCTTIDISSFNVNQLSYSIAILLTLLPGNFWDGQTEVIECLSDICMKFPRSLQSLPLLQANLAEQTPLFTLQSTDFTVNLTYEWFTQAKLRSEQEDQGIKQTQDMILSSFRKLIQRDPCAASISYPLLQSHWEIYISSYLKLLLFESRRLDSNYKLAIGATLSHFPFEQTIHQNQSQLFCELFDNLFQLSGLFPDSSQSIDSTVTPPSPPITNTNNSSKRLKFDPSSAFGNRYGTLPQSKAIKTNTNKRILHNSNPSDLTNTNNLNNNNITNTTSTSQTEVKPNRLPAFTMSIIETLSNCWSEVPETDPFFVILHTKLPMLITTIDQKMNTEIWSIKRSLLLLIGSIGAKTILQSNYLENILLILKKGLNEPKYLQVKLSSLISLERILDGINKSKLKTFDSLIRDMIRQASLDSQSSVLEISVRLQTKYMMVL